MKLPRLTLKTKLLLFSVLILTIPWIGYKYITGMESFLRSALEETLKTKSRAIASILESQPQFITQSTSSLSVNDNSDHIYLRPLKSPIQLDGYLNDWTLNDYLFQQFGDDHLLQQSAQYYPDSLSFEYASGSFGRYLYAVFRINDEKIIYRNPGANPSQRFDHLRIGLQSPDGEFMHYLIGTEAPGELAAMTLASQPGRQSDWIPVHRIRGAWQETARGYNIELRIPLSMIGKKIGFAVADTDSPDQTDYNLIGAADTRSPETLASIVIPSSRMDYILHQFTDNAARIWIVDNNRKVIATAGNLQTGFDRTRNDQGIGEMLLSMLYRLILTQPDTQFEDELSGVSKLNSHEINTALSGQSALSWRQTRDSNTAILTATYPVRQADGIIGAIMLEQNSHRILLLQNRAMEELLNLSIPVIAGGTVLVLIFAGRLTARIHDLHQQTKQIINEDGKITGTLKSSRAGDEIGDLSRTFSHLLERLQQYTQYLETMSGKLSHEIRTPLSVVRTSLENLEQAQSAQDRDTYVQRAREGIERLTLMLNRLSEATRLEQALQTRERHLIHLDALLKDCIAGYQAIYPDHRFEIQLPDNAVGIEADADLIAQMLDKLVANAVDFTSDQQAPIKISLQERQGLAVLSVANQGPLLPEQLQAHLFDSLVSLREHQRKTGQPHLGLGLYIVKLIAEHHGGQALADNLDNQNGVIFTVNLPTVKQ